MEEYRGRRAENRAKTARGGGGAAVLRTEESFSEWWRRRTSRFLLLALHYHSICLLLIENLTKLNQLSCVIIHTNKAKLPLIDWCRWSISYDEWISQERVWKRRNLEIGWWEMAREWKRGDREIVVWWKVNQTDFHIYRGKKEYETYLFGI